MNSLTPQIIKYFIKVIKVYDSFVKYFINAAFKMSCMVSENFYKSYKTFITWCGHLSHVCKMFAHFALPL